MPDFSITAWNGVQVKRGGSFSGLVIATTDANGDYRGAVSPGDYFFGASLTVLKPTPDSSYCAGYSGVWYGSALGAWGRQSSEVIITSGEPRTLDFTLPLTGSATVQVLSASTHQPVANALVSSLFAKGSGAGGYAGCNSRTTSNGLAVMTGIPAVELTFEAGQYPNQVYYGDTTQFSSATQITIPASGSAGLITINVP